MRSALTAPRTSSVDLVNSDAAANEANFGTDKDHTRPNFQRKPGELGIFIDVFDAIPNDRNKFGSRQFFLMDLRSNFHGEIVKGELFKVKGFFAKRNLLIDMTLERIVEGILLIVYANSEKGLDSMVRHYKRGNLEAAFVECFTTPLLEKKLDVTKLKIKIKLFDDEIDLVKSEFEAKALPPQISLDEAPKDIRMLQYIRNYQKCKLSDIIINLKDEDIRNESTAADFCIFLKQFSPENRAPIKTLHEAQHLYDTHYSHIAQAQHSIELYTSYLAAVRQLQTVIRDMEIHLLFPFMQLRAGWEKPAQREVRETKIQTDLLALKEALRDKSMFSLQSQAVRQKVPMTERVYYEGMLCVIPAAILGIIDIDQLIDHYFQSGDLNQKIV